MAKQRPAGESERDRRRATVLIVDYERSERDRMGRWFERTGYDVLACPGPTPPHMTCLGASGRPCPLVEAADLVVLDLWLQSDTRIEGTSSLELLMYYISTGRPIIALRHGPDASHLFMEERLAVLDSPPGRAELLETARAILGQTADLAGPNGV